MPKESAGAYVQCCLISLVYLLVRRATTVNNDAIRLQRSALLNEMQLDANGNVCPILSRTVPRGVAYHHGGLTHDERRVLEEAFVAADGVLPVLVCTSTLAAGVNLPARRVIIRSPFLATDFLTQSRYRQIIGRAGRTGFETVAEAISVVSEKHLDQVCFSNYYSPTFFLLKYSFLKPKNIFDTN